MTGSGAELIRQMVAGDREAFARFYDRYAPLVFPLIQRILRERADASDVLQEVFWEAWQGAAGYDPARGSPEAWPLARGRAPGPPPSPPPHAGNANPQPNPEPRSSCQIPLQ